MSEMLCLNHICVSYGSRQILHGIDLSLQPGEFCALLGLNGSGKSTLLHLLDRLYDLPEGSGTITIGAP